MSRITNNLKKQLRELNRQHLKEKERSKELTQECELRQRTIERLERRINQLERNGPITIAMYRDHERPGDIYQFRMVVDRDWMSRRIFEDRSFTNGSRMLHDIMREVGRNLEKLINDEIKKI